MRFAVCPAATPRESLAGCTLGARSAGDASSLSGLRVSGPGAWVARAWLVDEAGNADAASAQQASLRFDPVPPDVTLAEVDPGEPQRITLAVRDADSGVAGGEIEIRREGGDRWISLPVARTAAGFTAVVPDETLPDGVYAIRARAVDGAGNERTTTARASGDQAHLSVPLRIPTRLDAGGVRTVRDRRGRTRTVLARTATAAFGTPVPVRGRLSTPGGNPLAGADVEVFERTALPDQPWVRVGIARTGPAGAFSHLVRPGPSRTVLLRYAGTPLIRPQETEVRVRIRAATSLAVDRDAVVNGDEVVFRGRVRGGPLPPGGKLLELQAYSRGGWRTFATPRARTRTRRWAQRYRFTATRGSVRYRFRAVLPQESGFPFARGASRTVAVSVRGL